MTFQQRLLEYTAPHREYLLGAPAIQRALAGDIAHATYVAFLTQAYHHVRHTVPLLMAVGSRLPDRLAWLQPRIVHYIAEEQGHDQWILNDIEAAGGDRGHAAQSRPDLATDAMVAFAYDVATRRNPVGFFGMVHVLEGTSVALALRAAERIQGRLALPDRAFTYLRSHGKLDQEHVEDLAGILERLDDPHDREAVVACAQSIYWLYGTMFRRLDLVAAAGVGEHVEFRRIA
jgi:pyrroloquinoline quinone (PQQ) biosynthesis protein C